MATPARHAEVAIVGLGAMGSLCAWQLASRGARVIAFERYRPGHPWGSSHGDTRMIRTASRGPDYVPWVRRSFELWRRLEVESRATLLTQTGALLIGSPDGPLTRAARARSEQYGLRHSVLSAAAMRRRHPEHVVADDEIAVKEDLAGLLRPEAAVVAAAREAERHGATLMTETQVSSLQAAADGVAIDTDHGRYFAERVVVCAGARTTKLIPDLELPLSVERQVLAWFEVDEPARFAPERFPVFTHELPGPRYMYGFPTTDGRSVKVAVHHDGSEADPDTIDREVHDDDLDPVRRFARERLCGTGAVVKSTVCMYTNTPDGLFYATALRALPGALVVNACNGDGFKFAAVIGELLADLIVDGRPLPRLFETEAHHLRAGRP